MCYPVTVISLDSDIMEHFTGSNEATTILL